MEIPISFQSPPAKSVKGISFTIHRTQFVGWAVDSPTDPKDRKADHDLLVTTLQKMPCVEVMAKTLHRLRRGSTVDKPVENQTAEEKTPEQPPTDTGTEAHGEEVDPYADPFEKVDPKMFLVQKTTLSLRPFLDMIDKLLYPLLRWIICSNRSYFKELVDPRERIAGVNMRYTQFKMVMGSPDKEARFLAEREKECSAAPLKSIWAFHGMRFVVFDLRQLGFKRTMLIHQLLDIVRKSACELAFNFANWVALQESYSWEGVRSWYMYVLTFIVKQPIIVAILLPLFTDHGLQSGISTGYAGTQGGKQWPASKLRINHCMSLNEIVNAPSKFQSRNPYLVVQNGESLMNSHAI